MEQQLAQALARLTDLEQKVARQDAELARFREASGSPPAAPLRASMPATDDAAAAPVTTPITSPPSAGERPDRRTMLRTAGLALAGAAGAATVLEVAGASPAAATDNSAVLAGASNTATFETKIDFSGATLPSNMFTVANGATAGATGAAIAGVAAFESPASHGVVGLTDAENGYGVYGRGRGPLSVGVTASGDRAGVLLRPSSGDPRTSPIQHEFGEVTVDLQSNTWACVATGIPGTWRKLAGPETAGSLHLLASPVRVYDSRVGFDPVSVTKGVLGNGQERVIDTNFGGAVPLKSVAALINLTATNTNDGGWLAAFKNGIAFPGTSTLNWSAIGTNIANSAVVALDTAAKFKVRCAGSTDFAVDVIGYYA